MNKATKNQRLREKIRADVTHSKQSTLKNPSQKRKDELIETSPEKRKQIEIAELDTSPGIDGLILRAAFRLKPSRISFSKVTADLYFDGEKIESLILRVLQGPLATDNSEFSAVLDTAGISAGQHTLRVEMYEIWGSTEKLTVAAREAAVSYVTERKEDRLIRVPIVKSVAGADLAIASSSDNRIFREIGEKVKKETVGTRDYW